MNSQFKIPRAAAVARIHRQWPQADEIRKEDAKCPNCKRLTLWTYQLPGDHPRGDGQETCGYWCNSCGWGNGGSRPSIDTDGTAQ